MKKYKSYWFYLLLMLSISLTIIIINNINETGEHGIPAIPTIIKDINSGVIGAILTTIITLILLSNQTESQETLTKSSVVYEEKLKIFNNFLNTIGICLEDGKFTAQETVQIIHSFSVLRIHISKASSLKIEKALSLIDSSYFFYDENNTPNLNKQVELYTVLTNVFREELYGDKQKVDLPSFEISNLKEVLYKRRSSLKKPNSFKELIDFLQRNNKIIHTVGSTGNTIVFDIDEELIESLKSLHLFMESILNDVSVEITFSYSTSRQLINGEAYSGLPVVKLFYKNLHIVNYSVSERKRLLIARKYPSTSQIASFEIHEIDKLEENRIQIINEIKSIVTEVDKINV